VLGSAKAGWLISHQINDSFIVTNRLTKAKLPVYWSTGRAPQAPRPRHGRGVDPASPKARAIVEAAAAQLGVTPTGSTRPRPPS